jgi:hypothetical protein
MKRFHTRSHTKRCLVTRFQIGQTIVSAEGYIASPMSTEFSIFAVLAQCLFPLFKIIDIGFAMYLDVHYILYLAKTIYLEKLNNL